MIFGATCNGITDDAPAFAAFNQWAINQTLLVQLTIPPKSVCLFLTPTGKYWAKGIKQLHVIGYNATISDGNANNGGFFLGGIGVIQDNHHSARFATANKGDSSVSLLQLSDISLFTIGNWVLITGLDLMGYGYPPNPQFF